MIPVRTLFEKFHNTIVFVCLLAIIVAVPIPLGSNRPYAWFGLEIVVYAVLAFAIAGKILQGEKDPLPAAARTIMVVLVVWVALVFLQTVDVPRGLIRALNPLVFKLQQNLALISVSPRNTLSIDPGTTYNEFLKYGCYVGVFYLTLATVTTKNRLVWIVAVIVGAGVLEAIFGLYAHVTGFVIFPEKHFGNELRAGTFVNRNHFANMLTMVLGLVLGLLTSVVNSQNPDGKLKMREFSDPSIGALLLLTAVALILLAAAFTTGSRAPVLFFSMAFGIALIMVRLSGRSGTGEFVLAPLILMCIVAAIIFIGFDKSVVRLLDRNLFGGERLLQDASSLKLLAAVWMTGVGAGNYRWVFPMFRDDQLRFATYDHAHNDYLETAIGQGIPVTIVLGVAVFLILRQLYKGYKSRRNPLIRGVIFGCLLSMIFMLLHATVEFNFQIPANTVYFLVIAATGIAACRVDRQKRKPRRSREDTEKLE